MSITFPGISSSGGGGGGNAFGIVQPDSGTSPTAGSASDTLTVTSSDTTVTVTGNAGTKSINLQVKNPLNQNTSGTASNLSGTPALPNGTTAATQSVADNSTNLATTAYVDTLRGFYSNRVSNGSSSNKWTATNAALGDFSVTGTPVINASPFYSSGFGTPTLPTSNLPGVKFTAQTTGRVKCTLVSGGMAIPNDCTIALTDASGTVLAEYDIRESSVNITQPTVLIGVQDVTSGNSYTFKMQAITGAGTIGWGSNTVNNLLQITLEYTR